MSATRLDVSEPQGLRSRDDQTPDCRVLQPAEKIARRQIAPMDNRGVTLHPKGLWPAVWRPETADLGNRVNPASCRVLQDGVRTRRGRS